MSLGNSGAGPSANHSYPDFSLFFWSHINAISMICAALLVQLAGKV
jgi:hypothetical protein